MTQDKDSVTTQRGSAGMTPEMALNLPFPPSGSVAWESPWKLSEPISSSNKKFTYSCFMGLLQRLSKIAYVGFLWNVSYITIF